MNYHFTSILLFLILKILPLTFCINLTLPVNTKNGALFGENRGYYKAFTSIPYAYPPVGELRFEPPKALAGNWSHILNATQTASKCLQWITTKTNQPIEGSEDCLYLNIFVPNHDTTLTILLPVMFFIHGGGLMWGSADFYGEEYIMQNGNIILVTLNYRLGPFGFLSTEDKEIPGNMGFKDQALALKWIYENILYFGGDNTKILLSGWSAGGASVNFHLVSELTQPEWFNSAASFSGTALCPCHAIYSGAALEKTKLIAGYLNCSAESLATTKGIKDCLKTQAATDIIRQIKKFYKYANHPFAIFGPVVEDRNSAQPFLLNHVEYSMHCGKVKAKPWLLTLTAQDGGFGTAEFLKKGADDRELIYTLNEKWTELAPIMLFFNNTLTKEQQVKLAADLRQTYFGSKNITLDTYTELQNLYNVELSIKHVKKVVELYENFTSNSKAYGYVYDNPPPFSYGNMQAERADWKFGTLHGDDISLIFNTPIRHEHPLTTEELKISKQMIEMLVELARTGIPVYEGKALPQLKADNRYQVSIITKNGIQNI